MATNKANPAIASATAQAKAKPVAASATVSTESFCKRVSADVPAELETALRPLITAIQTLNEQIRCCDKHIEALATETRRPRCCAR
jgi:hypothetical protein